ncbi:hypothetical protein KBZ75_00260 [Streptomyces sp. RK76]|nr:hypothetical protein [Streptomyces sp. RK76]
MLHHGSSQSHRPPTTGSVRHVPVPRGVPGTEADGLRNDLRVVVPRAALSGVSVTGRRAGRPVVLPFRHLARR